MSDKMGDFKITFDRVQERQRAVINGDIIFRVGDNSKTVEVGNTGLVINFRENVDSKYDINADFMPGGKLSPGLISPMEATKVLAFGISKLRNYLLETDKIDKDKISYIESRTNPVFSNYLLKLFSNSGHSELIEQVDNENIRIDLKTLLNLNEDDKLIAQINRFSKRADGMIFEAMVEV